MQASRLTLILVSALVLTFLALGREPAPAMASANVNLDPFRGDDAEAKAFGPILENGQQYTVTVIGTYSKWPASQWTDDGICTGTPENSPMTPSSGTTNGKVGLDPEWRFATPVGSSVCNEPAPDTDGSFQISVDGGASFQNLTADNQGVGPNPAHQYEYTVTGQGQIIAFRILDPDSSSSNYGKILITVEAACQNTAVTVWEEASGGNGHSYQGVCSSATWDESEAALESTGGNLATITDGAENAFVYGLIDDPSFWSLAGDFCPGPFIGGYQTPGSAEPAEGWAWVTGEQFSFTNWAPDEPGDSDFANENRVAFGSGDCGPDVATSPVWHDVEPDESGVRAYVAEWDVSSVSVEFTQAIQQLQTLDELQADLAGDGEPPVPIVAGKPAAMRVYFAEVEEPTSFTVEVSGEVSGQEDITLDAGCTPTDRRRQAAGCTSVDFYFTPPEGDWSVRLVVKDFADAVVLDEEFSLTSKESDTIVIKPVSVCHAQSGIFTPWTCQSAMSLLTLASHLRKIAPTDDVVVLLGGNEVKRRVSDWTSPEEWMGQVRFDIENEFTFADSLSGSVLGQEVYYFGLTDSAAGGYNGIASGIPGRGALARALTTGLGTTPTTDTTVAHEMGHLLGLSHTGTALPTSATAPGCWGNGGGGTDWPFPDNKLYATSGSVEAGFDVATSRAIPGETTFDMMSYCEPRWVSPHRYLEMLSPTGPLAAGGTAPQSVEVASATGPFWLVSGRIGEDTAEFEPLVRFDMEGPVGQEAGPYRIEVRDGQDAVLFTRSFTPIHGDPELGPGQTLVDSLAIFSELVPVQAGAARIAVIDDADVEVGSLALDGAAPAVTITQADSEGGLVKIAWSVVDADSAEHTYWVDYSSDGGTTWQNHAMGLSDTSLALDADVLAGSTNALVRVIASDGVNSGETISDPVEVADKLPEGEIIGPTVFSFRLGELVWLEAAAWDVDDGALDDGAVTWSSNKDGSLGTGASLPVYDLSPGQHTITMTARDSDNHTVTDTITLTVFDGPIVEAGAVADIDCSGNVDSLDALALLFHLSGLNSGSCKTIGAGEPVAFGDVDCDGSVDPGDLVAILALVADLPSGCSSTALLRQ